MKSETNITIENLVEETWEGVVELEIDDWLDIITVKANTDTIVCQIIEAPSDESKVHPFKTFGWPKGHSCGHVEAAMTICAINYHFWLHHDRKTPPEMQFESR